ncbi:hypothetical protein LLG88_13430 [bacterium]|nr:hypothetical protein [bacterium]
MALITEQKRVRNADGHSCTVEHVVNTGTPPRTVYMLPRLAGRSHEPPPAPTPCPDCGVPVTVGSWPFCPHDGRPNRG